MKKFRIIFQGNEEDQRLFNSSVKALQSEALTGRYGYTVEHDTSAETTTLTWWRLPTGGFDASK